MIEAVRTTASPMDIWFIVVVMVLLLAFWLTAIMLADRFQVKRSGRYARMASAADPALGDAQADPNNMPSGERATAITPSVPGAREPAEAREPARAPGQPAKQEPLLEGDAPTRPDLPAQPSDPAQPTGPARSTGRHAMPAPRSGDTDRAERSHVGLSSPEDDETGR